MTELATLEKVTWLYMYINGTMKAFMLKMIPKMKITENVTLVEK